MGPAVPNTPASTAMQKTCWKPRRNTISSPSPLPCRDPQIWEAPITHMDMKAKKIIQRTKHTSPLHSRKGRSSTFGNLLLPFILLNLPYRHHSIWRLSKHHYTKSKEASSHTAHLHEHLCSDTGELWTNQSRIQERCQSQRSCSLKAEVSKAYFGCTGTIHY